MFRGCPLSSSNPTEVKTLPSPGWMRRTRVAEGKGGFGVAVVMISLFGVRHVFMGIFHGAQKHSLGGGFKHFWNFHARSLGK